MSSKPRVNLRGYQRRIVNEVASFSSIVILPTGAGKTLLAAEVAVQAQGKTLFLVPTCLLVEQQAIALREYTGYKVCEFMGGRSVPLSFDILVSTPKAFQMAQAAGHPSLQWPVFKLLVFDEVHHVLKDHPFRNIALQLRRSTRTPPQVLGLTASLTYAVEKNKVEASMNALCADVGATQILTASLEELRADGYHGSCATAEVRLASATADVPSHIPDGVVPEASRKPHLMASTFFNRLQKGTATPFSMALYSCIRGMECAVKAVDTTFSSPLKNPSLSSWGSYAHKKIGKGAPNAMYAALEHWYEALKMLVVSWEEGEDAAATYLRMTQQGNSHENGLWPADVVYQMEEFWSRVPDIFPRFEHLKDTLIYKADSTENFRGIIFVQQRIMTHILAHIINNDGELRERFSTTCLYATSSAATSSYAVSPSQAKESLRLFSNGTVNLLITTVVSEEGMDVPESNCVIRYDPMHHAVSFVQGRGRARQSDSSFVVLSERADRPVDMLANMEQQQLEVARTFQPTPVDKGKEQAAQVSRERNAVTVLSGATEATAVGALNLYAKKTKVILVERASKSRSDWLHEITYESCLRPPIKAEGLSVKKAAARATAAYSLINLLLQAQA